MELNVDTISGHFLQLTCIHQLQNSCCFEVVVIDLKEASQSCGQLVLLQSSHILTFGNFDQTAHHLMAADFVSQIQRSLKANFSAIRNHLASTLPQHVG